MNILLYHFGYRGDILVVGQNFTRELRLRYPTADIDLMVRPRMKEVQDYLVHFGLYRQILFGEKNDFNTVKGDYDLAYIIDERVYPEGNLRTVFSRAGFPFRLHPLTFVTLDDDNELAARITRQFRRPIIATQDDMSRKWPHSKVEELWRRLSDLGSLLIVGPDRTFAGPDRPLTFRESAAVLKQADIFVGIDSGIAHAAALVGTQTILLPPVFPESWISPTEYANCFVSDEANRHISLRPPSNSFCGHYLCLRPTRESGIARRCGDPLRVKCVWKKRWGMMSGPCCFTKIEVDTFYNTVKAAMELRKLLPGQ